MLDPPQLTSGAARQAAAEFQGCRPEGAWLRQPGDAMRQNAPVWQRHVDDEGQALDVDAARRDVRAN